MAEKPGAKKPAAKGPVKGAKKKGRSLSSLYTINGEKAERKNKFCPKCGPGYFLSMHKDRTCCGKCAYTEFRKA
jgi:small subunit ribosomal protein S27Ae